MDLVDFISNLRLEEALTDKICHEEIETGVVFNFFMELMFDEYFLCTRHKVVLKDE